MSSEKECSRETMENEYTPTAATLPIVNKGLLNNGKDFAPGRNSQKQIARVQRVKEMTVTHPSNFKRYLTNY